MKGIKMRVLRMLLVLCVALFAGCATLDFDQKLQMAQEIRNFAAETGAAYVMEFEFDGRPGIGLTNEAYFNTDVSLVARVSGRSRPSVLGQSIGITPKAGSTSGNTGE